MKWSTENIIAKLVVGAIIVGVVCGIVLCVVNAEDNAWKHACTQDTREAYESFAQEYPESEYFALAQERIEDIKTWEWAENINTEESYQEYISEYANGRRVTQAQANMNVLKLNQQEIDNRYDAMSPLIESFQEAKEKPKNLSTRDEENSDISIIPVNKRLFYIQEILLPELDESLSTSRHFVTYDYQRGNELTWTRSGGVPVTKSVIVIMKEYVLKDGIIYLINEARRTGDSGNFYEDLVQSPIRSAGHTLDMSLTSDIKHTVFGNDIETPLDQIETVIGYATGLFPRAADFSFRQRVAALEVASTSNDWADRDFAEEELRQLLEKTQENQ